LSTGSRPENKDQKTHGNANRDFEESVNRDGLSAGGPRNEHYNNQCNARISVSTSLHPQHDTKQSDQENVNTERPGFSRKYVAVIAPTVAPIAVPRKCCTDIGNAALSVDCMTINVDMGAQ